MDWEGIVPLLVPIVLFLTVGSVLILRPISTRLGVLLEAMAKERSARPSEDTYRLREEVERLRARLELLEDRQDFTDGLLEAGRPRGREAIEGMTAGLGRTDPETDRRAATPPAPVATRPICMSREISVV